MIRVSIKSWNVIYINYSFWIIPFLIFGDFASGLSDDMSIGERRRESVVAKRSSLSGFLNQYCVKGLLAALVEGVEENTLVVTVILLMVVGGLII